MSERRVGLKTGAGRRRACIAPQVLVIGLGNPLRGDDGVGPQVVQRLDRRWGHRPAVRLAISAGSDLIDLLASADGCSVVAIDAADLGRPPGAWIRIRVSPRHGLAEGRPPALAHAMGLAETLALLEALALGPSSVIVFGVQPGRLGWHPGLSRAVRRAVGPVTAAVERELTAGAVRRKAGKVIAGEEDIRACLQPRTPSIEE